MASYRHAGFPYSNWQPYEALRVDIHNAGEAELVVELVFRWQQEDETPELAWPVALPPGKWSAVELPISELADRGVNQTGISSRSLGLALRLAAAVATPIAAVGHSTIGAIPCARIRHVVVGRTAVGLCGSAH